MDVRIVLAMLVIFLGFLTTIVECRRCFNSDTPDGAYGACPNDRPKCCGSTRNGRRNQCAMSCVHFKCETNYDCDGLTCCSGNCSDKKNCLPVTPWGVVGIAIVSLFVVLAIFRACQWCHKRKVRTQEQHATSEEQVDPPPFVVSDFENHGFITPMAPPPYESVVLNDRSRTDEQPPIYNLNLQTIINNSSTNDTNNLVHEVNISIRGSNLFNTADFPPSYSEISSPDNVGEPPSYNSSLGSAENFEEGGTISFSDEPPPYSLNEESPNNTTTDLNEEATLNHDSTSSGEPRTVDIPVTIQSDHEQPSNDDGTALESSECAGETSNDGQPCSGINQAEDTSSELSSNSILSRSGSTYSQTTTTHL